MSTISRRSFISLTSVATASLVFPNIIFGRAKNKRIGVALLGLGSYSTFQLAPALTETEHCYLAGIITGSPEKVPRWQAKYNIPDRNIYSYEGMDQIANNDEIDVIYVVTPTGTHADFVLKAAQAGKHVWCEKPMAMNVVECQAMIDACNQNRVKLTIGYRVQHEPNTQTLNSYAKSLPFGKIREINAAAGYAGGGGSGWRFEKKMGGGALYDMGVYTVNGIRNALNLEPLEVRSARQYSSRPHLFREVDETTEYELLFPGKVSAHGQTSVGESMNHLRVICETGHYEMRPMQTYSGVKGSRSDGLQLNTHLPNQQARQMDDDALALLSDREMSIHPSEGLKDVRIIEAIMRSADTKQPVKF